MHSISRDAGLHRVVGPVALATSMVNMVVGAAIFVVPAQLSADMGTLATLAVLICAVGVGAIGICLAEAGSRVPSSGGLYAVIDAAFGPCTGYVAGTLFWISNLMACAAVIAAMGDAAAALLPDFARGAGRVVVPIAVVSLISAVNIAGVRQGMRLVGATTFVKLVPIGVFLVAGLFVVHASNFAIPVRLSAGGVGQTLLLTLFSLQGFETSLCANGEVRDPTRTIPRALFLSLGAVTLLYIAIQLVAQGALGAALAHSAVPLADAMGRVHPLLRVLLLIGSTLSLVGWMTSDLLGSPRILFAFARDGLLFPPLARLSRRGTPYVAILTYAMLAVLLASTGSFAQLAAPAALVMAALYVASAAAAWQLARRGVALAGRPLGLRWLGAAVAIGAASMTAMILLGTWAQILGLLVSSGGVLLLYLVQTRVARLAGARQPAA